MKLSNIIISITGLVVKCYMLVAIVWSKGNELQTNLFNTKLPSATTGLSASK